MAIGRRVPATGLPGIQYGGVARRPAISYAEKKKLEAMVAEAVKMGALGFGIGIGAAVGTAYSKELGQVFNIGNPGNRARAPGSAAAGGLDFPAILGQALGVNVNPVAAPRPRPAPRRPVRIYGVLVRRRAAQPKTGPRRRSSTVRRGRSSSHQRRMMKKTGATSTASKPKPQVKPKAKPTEAPRMSTRSSTAASSIKK